MAAEADISGLMLKVSAARVRLAHARRQHRRQVLTALEAGAEPLPEEEVQELLATPPSADEGKGLADVSSSVPARCVAADGGDGPETERIVAAPSSGGSRGDAAQREKIPRTQKADPVIEQKGRAPMPLGWCTACWRLSRSPHKPPGVAHLYVPPCTHPRPRKGKGRGKASRALENLALFRFLLYRRFLLTLVSCFTIVSCLVLCFLCYLFFLIYPCSLFDIYLRFLLYIRFLMCPCFLLYPCVLLHSFLALPSFLG